MTGVVTIYDPPERFGFTWPDTAAGTDSHVLFQLRPDPLGTHLRLVHDLPAEADATEFAAGWHWRLDGVDDAARGLGTPWDEQRWRVLQKVYRMTL